MAARRSSEASGSELVVPEGTQQALLPTMSAEQWEAEASGQAQEAVARTSGALGSGFLSIRGGVWSFQQETLANPQEVVVLDFLHENAYYTEKFDPQNAKPPRCYALGSDDKTMAPPPELTVELGRQAETCAKCRWSKFGTSDRGKGKACKNYFRLALLSVAPNARPVDLFKQEPALLRVPPTSLKAFATYVRGVSATLHKAPFAVVTRINLQPHKKNQFDLQFEVRAEIKHPTLGAIVLQKREAVQEDLKRAPEPSSEDDAPPAATGKAARRRVRVGEAPGSSAPADDGGEVKRVKRTRVAST